jgi:hypothetical protein
MSVSTRVPKTYECARDECENTCDEVTSVEGSYCSRRCYQLERGRKLLNLIEHDHRFCAGCYHQLKEIERPPVEMRVNIGPVAHDVPADTWKNCLVGYEYVTEHGELGQRTRTRTGAQMHVDAGDGSGPVAPADQRTMAGVVCECGTTDTRDTYVRDSELVATETAARRLCDVLEMLGHEGQHDATIHAPTLLETVQASEEPNWALAVGRAIDAGAGSGESS